MDAKGRIWPVGNEILRQKHDDWLQEIRQRIPRPDRTGFGELGGLILAHLSEAAAIEALIQELPEGSSERLARAAWHAINQAADAVLVEALEADMEAVDRLIDESIAVGADEEVLAEMVAVRERMRAITE